MPVNCNIVISDEAHDLLEKIKQVRGFRNNSEAIEYIIKAVAKELS